MQTLSTSLLASSSTVLLDQMLALCAFENGPSFLCLLVALPVPMHSPSVVSRSPHDIRATDGYGAIIRPSPPVLLLWQHSTLALISLFALSINLDSVSLIEIYSYINKDPALIRDLEARATLPAIVDIALTHPKGFLRVLHRFKHSQSYWYRRGCLPLPLRQDLRILTSTREAQARNLVALTRSKGLCVLLLPSTDRFPTSSLHFLRTLCAFRHGMFSLFTTKPSPNPPYTSTTSATSSMNSRPFSRVKIFPNHPKTGFAFLPLKLTMVLT